MNIYSPEQLPKINCQFVAYGPPVRHGNPEPGGDPLTIRPQTVVQYVRGILIKEIKHGGKSGDANTVAIAFEPTSIGWEHAVGGHLSPKDPLVAYLEEAHAAGRSVDVAIETSRRDKTRKAKEPISPLTPIHALRGASNRSGANPEMGTTYEHTHHRVAMVDGRPATDIVSNPVEWAMLTDNEVGDIPPEGWRFFTHGDDWTQVGVIVPDNNAAAQAPTAAAPVFDAAGLMEQIKAAVTAALAEYTPLESERPGSKKFEGKPWEARTRDGRVNLGGYLPSSYGWTMRWAVRHLRNLQSDLTTEEGEATPEEVEATSSGIEVDTEEAWALAATVMTLADQVQVSAYDAMIDGGRRQGTVEPDRDSASHKEARLWVQWAIDNGHSYPGEQGDSEEAMESVLETWREQVVSTATDMLADCGRRAGADLASKKSRQAPAASEQVAPKDEGPSPMIVQALLSGLERAWDKPQSIVVLAQQAQEKGFGGYIVSMSTVDGKVKISYPAVEGEEAGPLESLARFRYGVLTEGRDGPAPAPQVNPQSSAAVPNSQQQPAPQQPSAPQPQPQHNSGDANGGYAPAVAEAVRRLLEAQSKQSMDLLRQAYEFAKEQNVLAASVSALIDPDTNAVKVGRQGQGGYAARSVLDVLTYLRNQATQAGGAPAPAPQQASALAPEEQASHPDPAPESQAPAPEAPSVSQVEPRAEAPASQAEVEFQEVPIQAPVDESPAPEPVEESASTPPQPDSASTSAGESPEFADDGIAASAAPEVDPKQVRASEIANSINRQDSSRAYIQSMIDEATKEGLLEYKVKVGDRDGKLRLWLNNCLKGAEQREAKAGAV